jgi:hypothetical protein
MTNLKDTLKEIGIVTGSILTILTTLSAILKILKPFLLFLLFLATVLIPNGAIIWLLMYATAENANRITEPETFLSLVAQATAVVSIYTFVWITKISKSWTPLSPERI